MDNLRQAADNLGVSYSSLYRLVNGEKELDKPIEEVKSYDKQLRTYIDNLEKRLETEQHERRRLAREVARLENELIQLKTDHVKLAEDKEKSDYDTKKWAIKCIYAEKKLNQIELSYEKLEKESKEVLCRDSKIRAREALKGKKLKLLP